MAETPVTHAAMRLSELLVREAVVHTHEAIAVVREVADRVMDSGIGVPDPADIELSSTGQIRLTARAKDEEPVRRLGQLLQALLVHSSPPVQVRLAISQATAPEPAYNSVAEYSTALAFFERPDRAGVIRA